MEKPTLPKGTRDFGPSAMAKRQFIFSTIRAVFQKFGFLPLETPAMENLSTLTGKYGEEGDQLLFNILESGDFFMESGMTVSKKTYYLIQCLKYITYEIFDQNLDGRYTSIKYISPEHAKDFDSLLNWLSKYSKTIWIGRMGEGLGFEWPELEATISEFGKQLESITKFLHYFYTSRHNIAKWNRNTLEIELSTFIMQEYDRFYNLIDKLFNYRAAKKQLATKGLRYDLTVPFARYVVMNRHEIALPFKRYQIQPVWRADRPQKGRYREFYQCDADVVGTYSLVCETEIILMIKEVFNKLNIPDYTIKINHRGVLAGMAETLNVKGKETELYTAIDKLDKIGENGVREELLSKGFEEASLNKLFELLHTAGDNMQKTDSLKKIFHDSEQGLKGITNLQEVLSLLHQYGDNKDHVEVDVALARGLSYYTGTIFEVKINNVAIGSVSGGGRYDNLTQAFGAKEPLPGIGISFGVDRIYDAMEELNLFPKETQLSSHVLICHLDEACMTYGFKVLAQLREADISSEIYPDPSKLKKQLDYANKKNIPFTIVIGSEEISSGDLVLKNMETGEQEKLGLDKILQKLKVN